MKKRTIVYLVILFFTLIQCGLLLRDDKIGEININETSETSITEVKNAKYIKEIEKDFSSIKNLEVLNYSKIESKWRIKAEIIGSKNEVISILKQLYNYSIENYSLKYSENKIFLELDLVNK